MFATLAAAFFLVSNPEDDRNKPKPTAEQKAEARRKAKGCDPDPTVICPDEPRR
jgi:hypothetical protein